MRKATWKAAAAELREDGRVEGREEGLLEGLANTYQRLKRSLNDADIQQTLGWTDEQLEKIKKFNEEKVSQPRSSTQPPQ